MATRKSRTSSVEYVVLLLLGIFLAQNTSAAPAISSVSGTVSNGNTITISGSGFGTKAQAGPMLWDDFDSGTNGSIVANDGGGTTPLIHQGNLSSYSQWQVNGGGAYASKSITFNNASPKSRSSLHARASFTDSSYWGLNLYVPYTQFTTGNPLYISFYYRMTKTGANFPRQSKALIFYDSSWQDMLYFSTGYNSCEPTNYYRQHVTQISTDYGMNVGGVDINAEWVRFENYLVQSGANQANGHWATTIYQPTTGAIDTQVLANQVLRTGSTNPSRITLGGAYYDMCDSDPGSIDVDDVYIDNTPARIEICDTSTWSGRNKCEVQLSTVWGTGTISATVKQGYLSNGSAYLYVIDGAGAVNTTGYPVIIGSGGGGDTTPPTSPTNLAATSPSQSSISVSWTASTDAVGVTGYIVERCQGSGCSNFTQVGTPTASPFVDSGLTPNTFYNYHVRARDAANNLSGWSNVVGATTQGASSTATRVFFDGSESGNTNLWSQDSYRNKCVSVTSSVDGVAGPHTGSRMIRCNWNGQVAWNDPASYESLILDSWPYASDFLVRFWIRVDTNLSGGEGPKYYRIGSNSSGPTTSFGALNIDGYQKLEFYNANSIIGGGAFWGEGSHAADHAWHEVELYIKQSSSGGIVRLWEDGAELVNFTNQNTVQSGGTWNPFYISSNWSGGTGVGADDTTNYVYWDDFEVYSDSSSGTAATGALSDASIQVSGSTPLPTINISANPTSITSGSSSTLTWSSTNATSCTASGSWTGTKATSGTQSVSPTSTSTYTLTCTGAGGSGNASATITVSNTSELIIDNTDTNTSQSGSWSPSTNFPGYYGTDYHYSPNATGHWFEWTATTLVAGTYEVYAYWNANTDRPTDVSYLITHSGGTATRNNVNQTQNGSQWNLLGTYTFGTTATVRVQSGGTGTEGTVADAIRFVKTNTTPCNTVTTSNFSQAAYNSYGAPFDAFQTSTNLMNTTCTSADTHTINLTTGVTGDTTRIIYTKGYWYDAVTTAWRQYTGTCTGALNGEWCQGSVSATITDTNVSTANAANPTYLVGMTCRVQGGSWKCGCRDTSCTNFSWQIQGAGLP